METKQVKDILVQISRHLMLQVNAVSNIGLLNGKMGIAIFFYHYSRYTGNMLYRDFAGELIDDIYADVNMDIPFDFENGFCGIGWGILHLFEEKFVDANVDEVLSEMDQNIMGKDIR
jgi:lantibiotic modifying enzyme